MFDATNTSLSVTGPAGGDSRTAWQVVDQVGAQHILKIHPDPEMAHQFNFASETTARLRALSYLAPVYRATGVTPEGSYALIEKLHGETNRPVYTGMMEQLLELNELQHSQAESRNDGWISDIVDSILHGRIGYCRVDTLLDYSRETVNLMRQLQEIATSGQGITVPCGDFVHFDFHPSNVLSLDGRITGIIDWDGTCTGDASFDLTTLLFYRYDDPNHRTVLTNQILRRSGADAYRLYMAHMILRQVDWSIRHHDPTTVDGYLSRARRILRDIHHVN